MRRTPRPRVGDAEGLAADAHMKLKGFCSAPQTFFTAGEVGQPGENSTSAPACSKAAGGGWCRPGRVARRKFLGARGEREGERQLARRCRRRCHGAPRPGRSRTRAVLVPVASSIEPPTNPRRQQPDRLRRVRRRVAEALLQVGRHRQVGHRADEARMRERLVGASRARRAGRRCRRRRRWGGERLEAESASTARRAAVPGIRMTKERARTARVLVQLRKRSAFSFCVGSLMSRLLSKGSSRAMALLAMVSSRRACTSTMQSGGKQRRLLHRLGTLGIERLAAAGSPRSA